ncbi:MAG TPA: hypothetical protein VHE53_00835 [Patescibacteria group bacterium]|nr:hypothetical protein [Patescibacteria group bacterium]
MPKETQQEIKLRLFHENADRFYRPPLMMDIALEEARRRRLQSRFTNKDLFEAALGTYAVIKQQDIHDMLEPQEHVYPWTESTSPVESDDIEAGPVILFAEQEPSVPHLPRLEHVTLDIGEASYNFDRNISGVVTSYVNQREQSLAPEEARDIVEILYRMLVVNAR